MSPSRGQAMLQLAPLGCAMTSPTTSRGGMRMNEISDCQELGGGGESVRRLGPPSNRKIGKVQGCKYHYDNSQTGHIIQCSLTLP